MAKKKINKISSSSAYSYYSMYSPSCILDDSPWGVVDGNKVIISIPVDGWEFSLFKNKFTVRVEAVSGSLNAGIGLKVAAYLHAPNKLNHLYLADKKEETSNPDVCFDISIKSVDDNYKKWFDIITLNQDGMAMKISSSKHKEIFEKLISLGPLLDIMKARVLLEKIAD
jgi:hypothetical protein